MEVLCKRGVFGKMKTGGLLIFLLISSAAFAQKPIKGIVIDSAQFSPLPGVNIQLKHTSRGTSTDAKGEFRLLVKPTDTLIFSLVGYLPEEFSALELEETVLIRMAEEIHMLQPITVRPRPDAEKRPPGLRLTPSGNVSSYGSAPAGINFAYFSKAEKEKRKLHLVLAEQNRQRNYLMAVTSPEIRERIIYDYQLSEDEYYQILASFNLQNGDSLYALSTEELVVVMNAYFKKYSHKR